MERPEQVNRKILCRDIDYVCLKAPVGTSRSYVVNPHGVSKFYLSDKTEKIALRDVQMGSREVQPKESFLTTGPTLLKKWKCRGMPEWARSLDGCEEAHAELYAASEVLEK